jgi:ketosteroid isomerase-like protein
MTEHPNVTRLRDGYAAFSRGDFASLNNLFAENVLWHVGGRNQLAADYQGRDDVYALFGKMLEITGGTFRLEVHTILADGDHGVALVVATGRRDGRIIESKDVHVFHLDDSRVVEFWNASTDQYAGDALFSR